MLIGVGINDSVSFDNLTDRMSNIVTTSNLRTPASSLFLAAHNIYVDGNILPIPTGGDGSHSTYSIGNYDSDKYFKKGIFGYIEVGDFDNDFQRGLRIGCLSSGNITNYGIIKEEDGFSSYKVQIGKPGEDAIDYGYFENLFVQTLDSTSIIGRTISVQEISATHIYIQDGFFERGRHNKAMGEWTTEYIHYYTGPLVSYQDIFELQSCGNEIIACHNCNDNINDFAYIKPVSLSTGAWKLKRMHFKHNDGILPGIYVKYSIVGQTAFIRVQADFRTHAFTGNLQFTTFGDTKPNKYYNIGAGGGPEILYIPTTSFPFYNNNNGSLEWFARSFEWMSTSETWFQGFMKHIGEGIIFNDDGLTQRIELIWLTPYINQKIKNSYLEIHPTSLKDTLIGGKIMASGQLEIL